MTAVEVRRQLLAAMVGNVLEYYDFLVYAFLAGTLAQKFFHASAIGGLLASFAAFGVGFLARPVGGALIGRMADRYGRRSALLLTVFGMALGTVGIGLLPTYESIGVLAPVLLVALRLIQGLAAGGEWGTATAFIVESAPAKKRGFYGSLGQTSIAAATLVSSVVVQLFNTAFSVEQMNAWGWRVPFLLGAILLPVGLYMRSGIAETPAFEQAKTREALTHRALRVPPRRAFAMMGQAFGFTILWTVGYYGILSYMPTFLSHYAGLSQADALMANSIALVVMVLTTPLFGILSDRIGRKPLLLFCCVGFLFGSYPLFRVLLAGGSFAHILGVQIFFDILLAAFSGAAPAALCEIFPTQQRTMLLSIGYSVAVAIFGGFAPFVSTWLIAATGSSVSPSLYITAAAVVSGIVIWNFKETAHRNLA